MSYTDNSLMILSSHTVKEYLAIGTVSSAPQVGDSRRPASTITKGMIQLWSMDCTCPADFGRDVPSDDSALGSGMKYEMAICVDFGEAWRLKWMVRGGASENGSDMPI